MKCKNRKTVIRRKETVYVLFWMVSSFIWYNPMKETERTAGAQNQGWYLFGHPYRAPF